MSSSPAMTEQISARGPDRIPPPEDSRRAEAFQDPFSPVTRERQRYLLVSSIMTLAFTYSGFHITKIAIAGFEGDANISSKALAAVFAAATLYLFLLFLVGVAQELKSNSLRGRYLEMEFTEYLDRWDQHYDLWHKAFELRRRQDRKQVEIMDAIRDSEGRLRAWVKSCATTGNALLQELDKLASGDQTNDSSSEERRKKIQDVLSQMAALSGVPGKEKLLQEKKRADLEAIKNDADFVAENAQIQSLEEQSAKLWSEADRKVFRELSALQSSADWLGVMRVTVEVFLPVVFSIVSLFLWLRPR